MSVTLLRAYGGFASGAIVTLPDSTESSLIAQGLATASTPSTITALEAISQFVTVGGNSAVTNGGGYGTPTVIQGPAITPNTPLGAAALTTYDTNGRVHVAGTVYFSEIYLDATNTWKGIGVLNGTVVGTDNLMVMLYGSSGTLLANSAVAGVVSANASVFQNIDFITPITLPSGRYFTAVQCNGTTATTRTLLSIAQPNALTGSVVGVFGTVPATITVPTTHTTAVGRITWMYTT